ncbi:MAG: DUF5709 domain-containing protein [Gordonia sp. (in: high G+C Gram-positive bacteria)]
MGNVDDLDDEYGDYESDQLQPEDTLSDTEVGDVLDRGYSPPDHQPAHTIYEHESLDERLSEEEPDVGDADSLADGGDAASDDADYPSSGEVGDRRSGRLIAPDEGEYQDVDAQLLGSDAGVDGAGASAEEAAVHVIEPD